MLEKPKSNSPSQKKCPKHVPDRVHLAVSSKPMNPTRMGTCDDASDTRRAVLKNNQTYVVVAFRRGGENLRCSKLRERQKVLDAASGALHHELLLHVRGHLVGRSKMRP